MRITILLLSLFTVTSCSTKELPPLKTVDYVEVNRFMGTWYVIAHLPLFVEANAYNATESYTFNQKENRIDVDYSHNEGSFEGKRKHYPQKAFIKNTKSNSEWEVQFFWPLRFPYLIIDLAPDYSYTVVGVPNRKYVWIMARTPELSEDTYQSIIKRLKSQHYDLTDLRIVPQMKK